MITVTTIQVRPSTNVMFYIDTVPPISAAIDALVTQTATTPEAPSFAAPPSFTLSPDGLTHTAVAVYTTQEQLDLFLAEVEKTVPYFFATRQAYCTSHGISLTRIEQSST
jgi:hypothetical protein